MKYRVILNVADDHPGLNPDPVIGMSIPDLVLMAFQDWRGMAVETVEPLDEEPPTESEDVEEPAEDHPGRALRERRIRLGLTVRALAQHSGIDRATITRAEDGTKRTRGATLGAIARALDEIEEARLGKPSSPASSPSRPSAGEVEFQVIREDGVTVTARGPSAHADEIGASVVQLVRDFRNE